MGHSHSSGEHETPLQIHDLANGVPRDMYIFNHTYTAAYEKVGGARRLFVVYMPSS